MKIDQDNADYLKVKAAHQLYGGQPSTEVLMVEWDPNTPPATCCYFPPQHIAAVVMFPRMRPSEGCVRELGDHYYEVIESKWQELADEKLKEWKKKNAGKLPFCSHHEGRWGMEGKESFHVTLEPKLVKAFSSDGKELQWMRHLWLICPGAPKDAKRSQSGSL